MNIGVSPVDVAVRAGGAADHHEPGRHGVAHPGGPQQPHHHTARRNYCASRTYTYTTHITWDK